MHELSNDEDTRAFDLRARRRKEHELREWERHRKNAAMIHRMAMELAEDLACQVSVSDQHAVASEWVQRDAKKLASLARAVCHEAHGARWCNDTLKEHDARWAEHVRRGGD